MLQSVVEPSRSENGCIDYYLYQDRNIQTKFFLYENWYSKEEQELQFTRPYIKEIALQLDECLAKPFEIIYCEDIS